MKYKTSKCGALGYKLVCNLNDIVLLYQREILKYIVGICMYRYYNVILFLLNKLKIIAFSASSN